MKSGNVFDKLQYQLFEAYLKNGGKLNMIINSDVGAEIIRKYMISDETGYPSILQCINRWDKLHSEYNQNMNLKVTDIPILHSIIYSSKKQANCNVFTFLLLQ